MKFQVNQDAWLPVVLINDSDRSTPLTGIAAGQVTVRAAIASGGTTFNAITLNGTTWKELNAGVYQVLLGSGANTATGNLVWSMEAAGAATLPYYGSAEVVEYDPAADDNATILSRIGVPASDLATILALAQADATLARKVLSNNWLVDVVGKQKIIYDDDGVTPLYTFGLKDSSGNPSTDAPVERRRV